VDWINLTRNRAHWWAILNTVMNRLVFKWRAISLRNEPMLIFQKRFYCMDLVNLNLLLNEKGTKKRSTITCPRPLKLTGQLLQR
jgi:hypothetical protein